MSVGPWESLVGLAGNRFRSDICHEVSEGVVGEDN